MKLEKLRNYLISSCRYIQTEAGVDRPATDALWVEWVVARSLCLFRSVDVGSVDAADVEAVLRLQVQEWTPFLQPEFHFERSGSRALVWAWDGSLRQQCCKEVGVNPDAILPETIVRPTDPQGDEPLSLVACWDGFEARGFLGAQLAVSRWWPKPPGISAWNQFRTLLDLEPVAALPEIGETSEPEGQGATLQSMLLPFLRAESTLFVLFFCLFLIVAAYQGSGILYASLATHHAESRVEVLNEAVTPVLMARDNAEQAKAAIESIASLHAGPLQMQFLADLLQRLAQQREKGVDVQLLGWDYRPNSLAISVSAESLSASDLLTVFESIPWLVEPTVGDDVVKGRMKISATLLPGWEFETVATTGLADAGGSAGSGGL